MRASSYQSRAAALVICLVALSGCDSSSPNLPPPPSTAHTPVHQLLGPTVPDGGTYTFDLSSGVNTLSLAAHDLGGHLYRVETATADPSYPVVRVAGHTVDVVTRGGGEVNLRVLLDPNVDWALRFDAGMSTASLDLAEGTLSGLNALAGISSIDLTLGAPHGNVVLSESGGVSTFAVHLPSSVPVRVDVDSGAGTVSLFGDRHGGVAAGSRFVSGDPAAPDRYTLEAQGGVSAITVDAN